MSISRFQRSQSRQVSRACFETLEERRLLSFSPAVNYATNATPSAIALADFNNDGKLDLATCANAVTGSVSVLLGDGAGGFGAAQRTVLLSSLNSIAAADFNNDTRPDIVVSDGSGFYILMGNGNGTFQPAISTFGGGMVAVGDFNSDNNSDVLVSWIDGDWATHIQVYRGNGQGGFAAAGDSHHWGWGAMAAVDLNNDGKLDVATAEGLVFVGNGDGSFRFDWGQTASLSGGGAIATGDYTGEGNADVIVAGNSVAVLRGKGDGGFDAPIHNSVNGTNHTAVATGDFNADGRLDAIVTDADLGTVSVMLGSGDGTLRFFSAFATGTSPSGVVVGDFNRDGRPDVAVSNAGFQSRNVSVLLNDGNWATRSWIGPASGGDWSTAAHWQPAGVPSASDVVSIAGSAAVTLSTSTTVAGLNLAGGATLHLLNRNDALTVNYSGASPIGAWNGSAYTGITGWVQTQRITAAGGVGVAEISGDVVIRAARPGDANLSGAIDADDYFQIDSGYASQARGYARGDFNYDGRVDGDDYFLIDSNYNTAPAPPAAPTPPAALASAWAPSSPPPLAIVFADDESVYQRLIED